MVSCYPVLLILIHYEQRTTNYLLIHSTNGYSKKRANSGIFSKNLHYTAFLNRRLTLINAD